MKHNDCRFYLATDVFKGICKRDKSNIMADDESCEHFEKIPKCKNCIHFSHTKGDLGRCMEKTAAYPEMIAVTCNDFYWI